MKGRASVSSIWVPKSDAVGASWLVCLTRITL